MRLLELFPSHIADGLFEVPLFDVSPGSLSFDALDRYFARPRPGLPYREAAEFLDNPFCPAFLAVEAKIREQQAAETEA